MSSSATQERISALEPKWKQDPGGQHEPRYIPDEIINWDSMDVVQPRPSKTMRPRLAQAAVATKKEHQPPPQTTAAVEQKVVEPKEAVKRRQKTAVVSSQNKSGPVIKQEQKAAPLALPAAPPNPEASTVAAAKPKRTPKPRKQGQTQEDKKRKKREGGGASAGAAGPKPRQTPSSTPQVATTATTTTTTTTSMHASASAAAHQLAQEAPVVIVSYDTADPPFWVKRTALHEAVVISGDILEELFTRGGEVHIGEWLKDFCRDPTQCISILRGWFRNGVLNESMWNLLVEEVANNRTQALTHAYLSRFAVICYLAALMRFQLKRGQRDARTGELATIQCIAMNPNQLPTSTAETPECVSSSIAQNLYYGHPVAQTTDTSCLCNSIFQRSGQEETESVAVEISTDVLSIRAYRRLFCIIAKLHKFQSRVVSDLGFQEQAEESVASFSSRFAQSAAYSQAPHRVWFTVDPARLPRFDLRMFELHSRYPRLSAESQLLGLSLPPPGMTILDCVPDGMREYALEQTRGFKRELLAFVAEKQSRDAQIIPGDPRYSVPSEWSQILTWKNPGRGRGRKKANDASENQPAWKAKRKALADLAESGLVLPPSSKRPKLSETASFTPGGITDAQSPSDFFNSTTNAHRNPLASSSSHTATDVALGITSFGLGIEGAPGVVLEDLLPPGTLTGINNRSEQGRFGDGIVHPPSLPKRGQAANGRRGGGSIQRQQQQHPRRPVNSTDDDIKATCPLCNQEFKTATRHGQCSICKITCKAHGKKSRTRTVPLALAIPPPPAPFPLGVQSDALDITQDDMIVYDENAENKAAEEKPVAVVSPFVKPLDLINKLPNPKFDAFLAHILGVDCRQMLTGEHAPAWEAYQYINQPGFKTRNVAIESCFGCRTGKRFCCECMVDGYVDRRHIFVGLMRADNQGTRKVRVAYLCSYKCLALIRAGTGGLFEVVSELKRLKIKDEHEAAELEASLKQQHQEEIINFDTETYAPTIPIPSLSTNEPDAAIAFDQPQEPSPRQRGSNPNSNSSSNKPRDVMRYHYENKRTPGRSALSRDVFYLDDPDLPLIFRLNNDRNSEYLKEVALKAVEAKKRAEGREDNDDSGSTDSFEKKLPGPILEEQEEVEGLGDAHHANNPLDLPPSQAHPPQDSLYAPALPTLPLAAGGDGFDLMGDDPLRGQDIPGGHTDMDIDLGL